MHNSFLNSISRIKWFIALFAICFALFPLHTIAAQSDLQPLEELQLAFWPEYDQAAVLVVYRFTLPPETSLPTQVTLRIPTRVGEPTAVAYRDASNQLLIAEYERQIDGEWTIIAIEMPSLAGQVEYYDSIQFDGDWRNYQFLWPGRAESELVSYEVQLPVDAEEMTIVPSAQREIIGQDGLRYRYAELGALAGSDEITIDIQYTKPSSKLSVDHLLLKSSIDEPPAPTFQPESWQVYLPWILGILGLSLIVAGGSWFYLLNRSSKRTPEKKTRRSSAKKHDEEVKTEIDASPAFCHHCGTQAGASDRFCRHCGTELRT